MKGLKKLLKAQKKYNHRLDKIGAYQMKTNVQETSIESYHSIINSGKLHPKQIFILHGFKTYGSMTNLETSRMLQLPINSVTPRVKELRQYGVLEQKGTKVDGITFKRGIIWGIK